MVTGNDPPPGTHPSPGPGDSQGHDDPVTTICPECGGVLSDRIESGVIQWRSAGESAKRVREILTLSAVASLRAFDDADDEESAA